MKKRWIYKDIPNQDEILSLAKSLGVVGSLATLLVQRGIKDFESAKFFFRPSLENLPDPFLMKDMSKTISILKQFIGKDRKILIYGDYDVDGTTAVALMYSFLKKYHPKLLFYLPDRHKEGYGVSNQAVEWAYQEGVELIISLDCGIKAVEAIGNAQAKGIDFIICDHHLPGEQLPPASAILNPKQEDCFYPFKELTGCGIGFKLIQAFCISFQIDSNEALNFLDLLVVSIALDMVPIVGENRILAYYGLEKLQKTTRPGLKALLDVIGLKSKGKLSIGDLVFKVGPRINAVGRLKHASIAVELLISEDEKESLEFARELNRLNLERKHLDQTCTQEALEMISELEESSTQSSTVLLGSNWHQGVIGIVAARCIEHFHRPTIIFTESEEADVLVGSGRSVPGFDLYTAIHQCGDLLLRYGGHRQAAGLSIHRDNLKDFQLRFEQIVQTNLNEETMISPLDVDLQIDLDAVTYKFYQILQQMAPFGPQNMRPVFVSKSLKSSNIRVLKDKHLSFSVKQEKGEKWFSVIGFNMAGLYSSLINANSLNLCYIIEKNEYQGKQNLQLQARDIQID